MLLLVLALLCFAGAAYALVVAPRRALRTGIGRAAAYGRTPAARRPRERGLPPLVAPLARLALRLSPRLTREAASLRLLEAGLSGRFRVEAYLAAKPSFAFAGGFLGLAVGGAGGRAATGAAVGALFAVAGFVLPDAILKAKARARRERILASLPNALDLLAVSVEAGLGLDGAVARYAETARGPLAEELARVVAELRVGATRQEVLRRFAERNRAPETASFVRAIVHADQLGVSLTRTLRAQAADARRRRRARAEEVANKAPVKMLFPTVFFVFPALFVIVLGPALLFLAHTFSHR